MPRFVSTILSRIKKQLQRLGAESSVATHRSSFSVPGSENTDIPRKTSLFRLFLFASIFMTGMLLIGTQTLGIGAAYKSLQEQLKHESESGAAALVWMLSHDTPSPTPEEWPQLAAELYDHGFYRLIRITDKQRNQAIEWGDAPASGYGAPGWLQLWLPLKTSEATRSFATRDGQYSGTVTIRAKDDEAMRELGRRSARMIAFILVMGMLWALFAIILVRWLERRILSTLCARIRKIGAEDFKTDSLPIAEFEHLSDALNHAQRQIVATNQKQTALIELLQGEIYRDQVTRLYNRRYFMDHFKLALNSGPNAVSGHLLMFRQRDLAEINKHTPRSFTDQWLRSSSDQLSKLVREHGGPDAFIARMNGSDFAILLPGVSTPQAALITERVRRELRALRMPLAEHGWSRWALAFTAYSPGEKINEILARLDHALMSAEFTGNDTVVPATQLPGNTTIGEYSWHNALTTALDQHRFSLSTKTLHDINGSLLHMEASLTLHDPDSEEPIPAALFLPPAVRLGLATECDIQAVRLGLDWLVGNSDKLALKLSKSSLTHPDFLARLAQMLRDRPALSSRLILEIDAHELVDHYKEVRTFCETVTKANAQVGLGQLTQQFGVIEHLHELPVSYLKIGGDFVQAISQSPGSLQLARTIVAIAQNLDIEVYAEDVQDTLAQSTLKNLGIRVMQGPGIDLTAKREQTNRHPEGSQN